jgi:hypothetical protein
VLAINTCPQKQSGVTARILNPFLDGLKEARAEVELFYSCDLLIFPCCGNLNCTVKTPGQCMACDDMRWLRAKIGQADVLVLASPLYFNGKTGRAGATASVKLLRERLFPDTDVSGNEPYEHAIHTTCEPVNLRKVVVVTGCGFWEIDDFYPVLTHLKALCYNTFPELAGCITGPVRSTVRVALCEGASEREIARVAREAGHDLVKDYLQTVKPLMPSTDGGNLSERSRIRPRAVVGEHGRRSWDAVVLYQF